MPARKLNGIDDIAAVIADSAWHMDVLRAVRKLSLNDWMIGAGFVRNAVWDHLHGYEKFTALSDIDVIYFDPVDIDSSYDQNCEANLSKMMPDIPWSVRNQARMHIRNDDQPYQSTEDAISNWLETPTCLAVRLNDTASLSVIAPFGVQDLFSLEVRPTPSGVRKPDVYRDRVAQKDWPELWPRLKVFLAD